MKINVDDFEYNSKPHLKSKKFGILTLTDNGFNDYVQKDSYTHVYLYNKHIDRLNKQIGQSQGIVPQRVCLTEEANENPIKFGKIGDIFENNNKSKEADFCISQTKPENTDPTPSRKRNQFIQFNTSTSNKKLTTISNKNNNYTSALEIYNKTENGQHSYRRLHKGFKSTQVPRIDIFASKTPKSTSTNPFKLKNDKVLKCIDSVRDQNEKMENILEETLKLPKIVHGGHPKPVMKSKVGVSGKFLGEKYNPYNFDYNFLKTTTRRNWNGALFQH